MNILWAFYTINIQELTLIRTKINFYPSAYVFRDHRKSMIFAIDIGKFLAKAKNLFLPTVEAN